MLFCLLRELTKQAHVVFEQRFDVVYAVFEHGDTLYAHTERETRVFIGVHAAIFKHFSVHHARAEHFNPARALAKTAAFAAAFATTQIHFHAGFGKREIRGAQAHFRGGREHFFRKFRKHTL